ncbi:MAG: transglycosylase SLT domain-containing protein [Treponema sp.]|nr:transglycosylase SLT domain-containing protein [Treponema sp.]
MARKIILPLTIAFFAFLPIFAAEESAVQEQSEPTQAEGEAVGVEEAVPEEASAPEGGEEALFPPELFSSEHFEEEFFFAGEMDEETPDIEFSEQEKLEIRLLKAIGDVGGLAVPETEYAQNAIKRFIKTYSSEQGKKHLCEALDRGETYRLYVREQLKKRNMPQILEYLPLIESDYVTTATSRVGAKGIWQFMENSMKPFLKKSAWLDERLDPWRSTDAAISKLQDNYRQFGNWELAIAAYNCGSGAMAKALRASKEDDFWYMAEKKILKSQTISYIPKLIAVATIAAHPDFYDIPVPEITESVHFADFDYVLVDTKINLYRLASELRMDADYLKMLNPALTRSMTPPTGEYELRFPSGMEMAARIALYDITSNPDKFWDDFESTHIVESGDTLWGIARKIGCSVEELCQLNKMKQTDVLKIGKALKLPIPYY